MPRFYTYKKQVPLKPGETIGYLRGHGYFARPAKPAPLPKLRVPPLERCVFFGSVDDSAARQFAALGPSWTAFVSADRGVWTPNEYQVELLRAGHGRVEAWCDCRSSDGTPAQAAIDLGKWLGTTWCGQAETAEELTNSVGIATDGGLVASQGSERASRLIANPNAWTPEQRATATRMVEAGDLSVAAEVYWIDPGYSSQGVPVSSVVYGVAMDGGVYIPLADYDAQMPAAYRAGRGVWHGSGLRVEA